MLVITAVLQLIICREGLKILSYQGPEYKEKKTTNWHLYSIKKL